ncbi:DUF4252 domain-containing protein [Flavobacterium cerinum]|uniref:DUF4252 domain-containing protein n=1 Tax=Flavobacterium cerinum TaxID=2502784 RepID=A0A444HC55_9FLAO|nr:DUF4252 domain-containing protein [Flavobacterium cerinum]RWX01052.1 DUF4252 domain-containing protein [Flavobacterium cerinum]
MKRNLYLLGLVMLLFVSCDQKPTLQKYFVEKGNAKDFMTVDIAPSFIKTDGLKLSADEQAALKSLHKLNVLVFQRNKTNEKEYDTEKTAVKALLKSDKYDELMKVNSGDGGLSVNTKGEGEHIEECVLFLHGKENGFGVIRVMGENMTPNNVMTIVGLLQKANLDISQLKPLQDMLKEK